MTFYDSAETLLKTRKKIVKIKQTKECKNLHYYSAWNILKYLVPFCDIFFIYFFLPSLPLPGFLASCCDLIIISYFPWGKKQTK